jgi:hypothetical protein
MPNMKTTTPMVIFTGRLGHSLGHSESRGGAILLAVSYSDGNAPAGPMRAAGGEVRFRARRNWIKFVGRAPPCPARDETSLPMQYPAAFPGKIEPLAKLQ